MVSIHVDLPALPRKSPYPIGYAKEQNINSLVIQLTADLIGFDFYVLKLLRGDGLIVESDELTADEGVLTVPLTSKFLYCSGLAEAQVFAYNVVEGELSQIKESAHFKLCIDPSVAESAREHAADEPSEKHIIDGEVTTEKIADGAVTAEKLADGLLDGKLDKAGGTMTGDIDMGGHTLRNVADPERDADAARKGYVDAGDALSEKLANRVTTIDREADNLHYPTALAVLNYVAAKMRDQLPVHIMVTKSGIKDFGFRVFALVLCTVAIETTERTARLHDGILIINGTSFLFFGRYSLDSVTLYGTVIGSYTVSPSGDIYSFETDADKMALKEATANKVLIVNDQSDDAHYPSAKAVNDAIQEALYIDTSTVLIPAEEDE